jgi:hypothetical protein
MPETPAGLQGSSTVERRALFLAMIREDDDEKRAELRRQYVEGLGKVSRALEVRDAMARYRRDKPLSFPERRFR